MTVNQLHGVSAVYRNLSDSDKVLIAELEQVFKSKIDQVRKFCEFIEQKMSGKNLISFADLSPEGQMQACLDYAVIGLVSGTIQDSEIKKLIQE